MSITLIDYSKPNQWGPGIFRVLCLPNQKTLFVKARHSIIIEGNEFRKALEAGNCSNEELLKDFKTYGKDNFQFLTVVMSLQLVNPVLMNLTFNKCRSEWPGPHY